MDRSIHKIWGLGLSILACINGSPRRPSRTGALVGHLAKAIDARLDRGAMHGKIAVLAATGASPLHGLMLEHQLRSLMGFFAIKTAATTFSALEDEIEPDGFVAPAIAMRISRAADEVASVALAMRRSSHSLSAAA